MDTNRIVWGVIAWFLGILVPVMHHVLLHWPLASQPISNVVTRSQHLFASLPLVDWVYLGAMTVVGLMLIVSGFRAEEAGR